MDTYENEIYEFVAKKENYKSAVEISNLLPKMRKRIVKDFWESVKIKLKEENNEWIVKLSDNVFDEYSYLQISKNEWKNAVNIRYEKLHSNFYHGIHTNNLNIKEIYEKEKIIEYLEKENLPINFNHAFFYSYHQDNENFTTLQTQIKALPKEKENFVNEVVNFLINFVTENEKHISEFSKMQK